MRNTDKIRAITQMCLVWFDW